MAEIDIVMHCNPTEFPCHGTVRVTGNDTDKLRLVLSLSSSLI